ncbi:hypothetical protein AGENTSMITH_68 [Bacillus phage vB_BspM_AgentSmith]|nr:hypothetical protein AGENTSMITH_68 [Bacillus phage vB_BspM_AgentSmith]
MYAIILKFIKDKLFSPSGIVLLGFGAIIFLFLAYNGDTVLSKFGFETKSSLKGDLIQAKADLKTLKEVNEDLVFKIDTLEADKKVTVEVLEELYNKKAQTKDTVTEVLKQRDQQEVENRKTLKAATVVTETTITMPKVNYERASRSNIEALHNAFALLN